MPLLDGRHLNMQKEKSGTQGTRMGFNFRALREAQSRLNPMPVLRAGAALTALVALGTAAQATGPVSEWTLRDVGASAVDQPSSPDILGTVALPVRPKATGTRWSKLMMASLDQPALIDLTENARGLAPEKQLAFVQSAVKHAVRTAAATYNCSDDGYWAPASETLARGMGDCFDVAIAKMEALRSLGFPCRDLYLTTGRFGPGHESGSGREAVALLVRTGERFWLLGEQSEQVIGVDQPGGISANYTPILTYGVGLSWVHGRIVNVANLNRTGDADGQVGMAR